MKKLLGIILPLVFLASCSDSILEQDLEADSVLTLNPKSEYIAIFGDIQYYTQSEPGTLKYWKSIEWLQRQSRKNQFNCILHTGDITQSNSPMQYRRFKRVTSNIADQIPYFSAIGDHDYSWEDGIHIEDRKSTKINDYVDFPLSTDKVLAYFEDGRMENIIVENTICGERYDLLILEFGPRTEVVEWANEYVASHPDIKFILLNHEYLEAGGGRRVKSLKCTTRLKSTSYTTPNKLWSNLIYPNDNIVCVLCGHVGGIYAVSYSQNSKGREVPQIQHNIQGSDYRNDNWLMLWEFLQESDSASVKIVNTKTQSFYNDITELFKFRYRY